MLRKSTKLIAIGGVILLLVSAATFVLFFRAVGIHKDHFTAQTQERAQLEAHKNAILTLMRTLDETKKERQSLLSRILKEEDVIDFLALVESLGREQGVTLDTSALTVESVDTRFESLVVKVTVKGSYESVIHVLKMSENLPYHTVTEQVRVGRIEDESGGELWESSYDIRVIKLKKV